MLKICSSFSIFQQSTKGCLIRNSPQPSSPALLSKNSFWRSLFPVSFTCRFASLCSYSRFWTCAGLNLRSSHFSSAVPHLLQQKTRAFWSHNQFDVFVNPCKPIFSVQRTGPRWGRTFCSWTLMWTRKSRSRISIFPGTFRHGSRLVKCV